MNEDFVLFPASVQSSKASNSHSVGGNNGGHSNNSSSNNGVGMVEGGRGGAGAGGGGGSRDRDRENENRTVAGNSDHKYVTPSAHQRRATTFMSQEDLAAGKKSTWNELEITGIVKYT